MNFLSAEEINQTSPYKVTQVDEMSVRFCTQHGVHYWVGLVNDIFILTENGYYLYLVNESEPAEGDPLVYQTVVAIISNFFAHSASDAMLYICSPSDSLQAARARLFKIWFNQTQGAENFTLQTYSNIEEGVTYFYGIILRKDNPYHDKMINIFLDFFSDK